jgi:epoxide hydrolase-like predicted phosphatase
VFAGPGIGPVMAVRAVFFDVGGVLQIAPPLRDFRLFADWEARLGLRPDEIRSRSASVWADGRIGRLSEAQVSSALARCLAWSEDQVTAFMADYWAEYLGSPNDDLIRYFRGLRPRYRTGIISNSFAGAREREQAAYQLSDSADLIVYSHETGICKPDHRIYRLACERLGVRPEEAVFLDDQEACVTAARDIGMHAVAYTGSASAIAAVDALLHLGR